MAKESGLGMTVAIDDSGGSARSIENDILSISFDTPQNLMDTTGLDKSGQERLGLLRDFTCSLSAVFNDAAGASSFTVFKVTTGARTVTIVHSGQTLANECLVGTVGFNRDASGSFPIAAGLSLQSGTVPAWA